MTVRPLQRDVAPVIQASSHANADRFAQAVDALGSIFTEATRAEDAYARGAGSLRDAVYDRVRADVALSVAVAAAQRSAQAMQTLLSMQI